ncbi:MAG: TrmH family RNA methyltransferase, partial [Clostridium sp.]
IALCIKYIYDKNENVQKSICKIIEKIKLNNNLNNNSNDNIIVLENVNDPGNLGSVLRTMSATGNKLLILVGDCVSQFSEKVIRSSMGAVFKIDILNISLYEFEKFVKQEYVQNNYITIGTAIDGENLYTNSIENVDNYNENSYKNIYENTSKNTFKNILIFGNEANGLSAEMFKLVKNKIKIPMEKNVESLNLAISVAIILYELYRRKKYCIHNTNKINNNV